MLYYHHPRQPNYNPQSAKSLLTKMNILSVNQMNAQIKLNEMWKSVHIINYPVKTVPLQRNVEAINTRAITAGQLKEVMLTCLSQKTFINDAIHISN